MFVTLAGCGLDGNSNDETPSATVEARFISAEEGFPIADTHVLISVIFEGEDTLQDQGSVSTDANGVISAFLSHSEETVISTLEFTLQIDEDVEVAVREDVNLELRAAEPFDSVYLEFEI